MNCPNEGSIQAYIDGELEQKEMQEIEMHIFQCEKCKEIYKTLSATNSFVFEKMQGYKKNNNQGYENFERIIYKGSNSKKGVLMNMKKYKNIAAAVCAVMVISTCVAVPPIRAAISDAVSIFRAKDIKSVKVSLDDVKKLQEGLQSHKADIDIEKIGKVKYEGGEYKNVTMEEAKKVVPFALDAPKSLQGKNIESIGITEPSKIDFTINVDNVNEIMKSLGGKKLFPKNLDGKTFSIDFKGTVNFGYTDKSSKKNISIVQCKVPEIIAPSEANVEEIFNALSELSVLPQELQKQLKSMKDWKNTLYIPSVDNMIEEMNIDGIKAFGNFENNNDNKYSTILFLKDDVIINVSGNVDKNEIIEIIKSMR